MKLKIHTANGVDMVECILIKKICESKNSYVYECKINDEYFNDLIKEKLKHFYGYHPL